MRNLLAGLCIALVLARLRRFSVYAFRAQTAHSPFAFGREVWPAVSGQVVVELSLLFCSVLLRVDIVKPELPAARMTFILSSFHFSFSFDSL